MASSSMVQKIDGRKWGFPKEILDVLDFIKEYGEEAARLFFDYDDDDLKCSGYTHLPSGLLVAYGVSLPNHDTGFVEFPVVFTHSVFNVQVLLPLSNDSPPIRIINHGFFVDRKFSKDIVQFVALGS